MKQQLKETVTYQPNAGVKFTVDNKPKVIKETGEILFEQVVTVKVLLGYKQDKLSFHDEDELREFLDNIEVEDPQQELPL